MFDFIKTNGLWEWMMAGFKKLTPYFSAAFINAFASSPNFIVFVISAILFVSGFCITKKIFKGLCKFWGGLVALLSVVEFILVRY